MHASLHATCSVALICRWMKSKGWAVQTWFHSRSWSRKFRGLWLLVPELLCKYVKAKLLVRIEQKAEKQTFPPGAMVCLSWLVSHSYFVKPGQRPSFCTAVPNDQCTLAVLFILRAKCSWGVIHSWLSWWRMESFPLVGLEMKRSLCCL